MRFDSIKELKGEAFRRLTGVQRGTFDAMAAAECRQKAVGGKPNTLGVEDQLLMMLGYWREYRTYFHIGQAYGRSRKRGLPQHQMVRKHGSPRAKPSACRAARPLRQASAFSMLC
jgi:Helix-turn-helix of DDE superfamily endonuclease